MPRDSSGNYTLPLGNPVVDGTVIDVNWANPTMNDIAVQLNNVLTRDGLLGPIAPFFIVDGTEALPGLAFISQNQTGLWRDATQVGLSVGGVAKQVWSSAGSQVNGNFNVTGNIAASGTFTWAGGSVTGNLAIGGALSVQGGINSAQTIVSNLSMLVSRPSGGTPLFELEQVGVAKWRMRNPGGTARYSIYDVTNAVSRIDIDVLGRVGIGVEVPLARLHVDAAADAIALRLNSTAATGPYSVWTTSGGALGYIGGGNNFVTGAPNNSFGVRSEGALVFAAGGASERARIDANGNLLVGVTSGSYHRITRVTTNDAGSVILAVERQQTGDSTAIFYSISQILWNAANAAMKLGRDSNTLRSLNAAGTLNASGADYAEYEPNGGQTFSKGDVVGFDADGVLTPYFNEAVRFGIKSTDPSYVGGDVWGTEEALGMKQPKEGADQTRFLAVLEAARQRVDRVAYSGKVPVNVWDAAPGGYIVAKAGEDGYIQAVYVADVDFAQYKRAVGRVNRILDDGRAEVAVIVH